MQISLVFILVGVALIFCGEINDKTIHIKHIYLFQPSNVKGAGTLSSMKCAMADNPTALRWANLTMTNAASTSKILAAHIQKMKS